MRNKTHEKIHEILMRQISLPLEQNNIHRVFLKLADNYYTPRLGILKGIPHLALFLSDF